MPYREGIAKAAATIFWNAVTRMGVDTQDPLTISAILHPSTSILFHVQMCEVAWPSGLRRWIKAPVSPEAWVRIPPLPTTFFSSLRPISAGNIVSVWGRDVYKQVSIV